MAVIEREHPIAPDAPDDLRAAAVKRLKAQRDFKTTLLVYLAVNALLTVIWATTNAGKPYPQGFFWPVFVMVGWGIPLAIGGYVAYRREPITEQRIQEEMRRIQESRR